MAKQKCSIEGCERRHHGRGWCKTHYYRWLRHGDPLAVLNGRGLTPYERVMDRTIRVGDCLEFTGPKRFGYGHVNTEDRSRNVARIVLEHHQGPSPLYVLHSCDNRACVEITHLRYGTQKENIRDMADRGRAWWQKK